MPRLFFESLSAEELARRAAMRARYLARKAEAAATDGPVSGVVTDVAAGCVAWITGRKEELTRAEYDLILQRHIKVDIARFQCALDALIVQENKVAAEIEAKCKSDDLLEQEAKVEAEKERIEMAQQVQIDNSIVVIEPVLIDGSENHLSIAHVGAIKEKSSLEYSYSRGTVRVDQLPAVFLENVTKDPVIPELLTLANSLEQISFNPAEKFVSYVGMLKSPFIETSLNTPLAVYNERRDDDGILQFGSWTYVEIETIDDIPFEPNTEYLTLGRFSTVRMTEYLRRTRRPQFVYQFLGNERRLFSSVRIVLCDDRDWISEELAPILYAMSCCSLVGPVVIYRAMDCGSFYHSISN
jgi:hypothetical protein